MRKAILDAQLEQSLDFFGGFRAQILANDICSQGQRQTSTIFPPLAEIDDQAQVLLTIGELAFMNNEAGIDLSSLVFLRYHGRDDLIKRHLDTIEIRFEVQAKCQVRAGQLAGYGDRSATKLIGSHLISGNDHGAVAIAHARATGAENVFFVKEGEAWMPNPLSP